MDKQDVIVIGSGVGGATVARRLAEHGISVLLLERGGFIPQEDKNWSVQAVFFDKKYVAGDVWIDRTGTQFRPSAFYNVGGCTKFYGAAMFRLREKDFEQLLHADGLSPAWPIRYADLEPYYDEAEHLFGVHGDDRDDPTAPVGRRPFPYPAIPSEPIIQRLAERLRAQGLHPSPLPLAVDSRQAGTCILCKTCDGFPCKLGAKNDAEICLVKPALDTGYVKLWTNAFAQRLILASDGRTVAGVEVEHAGETKVVSAKIVVVSCNAVNSAALLLRSADSAAPYGVANSSGVVGRNYMTHNQSALMALSLVENVTRFQKTLALNDYYFGDHSFPFPMGQAQMLGKLQGGMLSASIPYLPRVVGGKLARHSVDWLVLSEDLPDPANRVTLDGGRIKLSTTPNNMKGHDRLVKKMKKILKRSGYPVVMTKPLTAHATAHQCGTVRFGSDPATAALDSYCRSFDHTNLFVIDASFFPASGAVNPGLTIAAQALRASDHILTKDFDVSLSEGRRYGRGAEGVGRKASLCLSKSPSWVDRSQQTGPI
jgi:choline dehydrogenase-like flavoprotein